MGLTYYIYFSEMIGSIMSHRVYITLLLETN